MDRSIEAFNKKILKKNPEILTKSADEFLKIWKPDPDMELIEDVYQMLFRGWLLGMMHSSRTGRDDYADISIDFGLTFQEAIEMAGGRISLTPAQFERLSDDLKLHAFTVGRLTQLDMIEKVKALYVKQLESKEMDMNAFLSDVYELDADRAGFGGYYTTVYRTNLQKDYNAGKAYQMMQDPPMYLQFVGIDDERQSEICSVRTGVIRPYTDPWWDDNWPPLHYNCRSTVREIFPEEAKARGLEPTALPEIIENDIEDEDQIVKRNVPTNGFGRRPAIDNAFWGTTQSQQNRVAGYMIQEELNGVAGKTVCRDFSQPKKGFTYVETSNGAVRYDEELVKDSEFDANLETARVLAENDGYYVELRKAGRLEGNRQWDAWLNGIDKIEFKNLQTTSLKTIKDRLADGYKQAHLVAITLNSDSQINLLREAIGMNDIKRTLSTRNVKGLYVIKDGKAAFLSSRDLKNIDTSKLDDLVSR